MDNFKNTIQIVTQIDDERVQLIKTKNDPTFVMLKSEKAYMDRYKKEVSEKIRKGIVNDFQNFEDGSFKCSFSVIDPYYYHVFTLTD